MSNGKRKAGAPIGNKNGLKLKDPEIRQLAYLQYCEHLSTGKPKKLWRFQHSEYSCTSVTMEKYMKDEIEFDPIHTQVAQAEGFGHWWQLVQDSALGINKTISVRYLQTIMRNKYGWT